MRELWQGDYAHDGEIWQFPTSTSVPKPIQQPTPPMWIAARDPDSHDFAVRTGCNVMVTPLMKGDEEVVDLKRKFDTAVANHPEVPRPEIMVLRHTHVHSADDPDGWRPAAEAISRFYRTFDAWFGNKTTPVNGFLEPSPESKFEGRPEFELESLHRTAMIGTPEEVIERLRYYQAARCGRIQLLVRQQPPARGEAQVPRAVHQGGRPRLPVTTPGGPFHNSKTPTPKSIGRQALRRQRRQVAAELSPQPTLPAHRSLNRAKQDRKADP